MVILKGRRRETGVGESGGETREEGREDGERKGRQTCGGVLITIRTVSSKLFCIKQQLGFHKQTTVSQTKQCLKFISKGSYDKYGLETNSARIRLETNSCPHTSRDKLPSRHKYCLDTFGDKHLSDASGAKLSRDKHCSDMSGAILSFGYIWR